jgi:hypothetical protein
MEKWNQVLVLGLVSRSRPAVRVIYCSYREGYGELDVGGG